MSIISSNSKNVKGIQFFPHEEIFYVEREHIIVLFSPFVTFFLVALLIIGFILTAVRFQYIHDPFLLILVLPVVLALFCLLSIFIIYIFMRWYYQFYIITSKRLIHIHYFRIGGFHLDEVFYLRTRPTEVERNPQNFLLDFLGIEDVYVYFKNLERTIPFIFQTPTDSDRIVKLLEDRLLEGNGK